MRKILAIISQPRLIAAAIAIAINGAAFAADEVVGAVDTVRVVATVDAINQATRVVTLKDSQGNKTTFVASDLVQNLAQVSVGDTVTMDYAQAIAVKLVKSSKTIRERTVSEGIERAPTGMKPGGAAMVEVKVVASI